MSDRPPDAPIRTPFRTPLTPADTERVRERAAHARARAQALAADVADRMVDADDVLARRHASLNESVRLRAQLRDGVARYAALLRALDTPPERALVEIKAAMREVLPARPSDASALMADVVRWSIQAYYSAS